jgi:hypothetical protein
MEDGSELPVFQFSVFRELRRKPENHGNPQKSGCDASERLQFAPRETEIAERFFKGRTLGG